MSSDCSQSAVDADRAKADEVVFDDGSRLVAVPTAPPPPPWRVLAIPPGADLVERRFLALALSHHYSRPALAVSIGLRAGLLSPGSALVRGYAIFVNGIGRLVLGELVQVEEHAGAQRRVEALRAQRERERLQDVAIGASS